MSLAYMCPVCDTAIGFNVHVNIININIILITLYTCKYNW